MYAMRSNSGQTYSGTVEVYSRVYRSHMQVDMSQMQVYRTQMLVYRSQRQVYRSQMLVYRSQGQVYRSQMRVNELKYISREGI